MCATVTLPHYMRMVPVNACGRLTFGLGHLGRGPPARPAKRSGQRRAHTRHPTVAALAPSFSQSENAQTPHVFAHAAYQASLNTELDELKTLLMNAQRLHEDLLNLATSNSSFISFLLIPIVIYTAMCVRHNRGEPPFRPALCLVLGHRAWYSDRHSAALVS